MTVSWRAYPAGGVGGRSLQVGRGGRVSHRMSFTPLLSRQRAVCRVRHTVTVALKLAGLAGLAVLAAGYCWASWVGCAGCCWLLLAAPTPQRQQATCSNLLLPARCCGRHERGACLRAGVACLDEPESGVAAVTRAGPAEAKHATPPPAETLQHPLHCPLPICQRLRKREEATALRRAECQHGADSRSPVSRQPCAVQIKSNLVHYMEPTAITRSAD